MNNDKGRYPHVECLVLDIQFHKPPSLPLPHYIASLIAKTLVYALGATVGFLSNWRLFFLFHAKAQTSDYLLSILENQILKIDQPKTHLSLVFFFDKPIYLLYIGIQYHVIISSINYLQVKTIRKCKLYTNNDTYISLPIFLKGLQKMSQMHYQTLIYKKL